MKTIKVIDLLNKIANGETDRNNKYQFSRDDYCTIQDFFARYIIDEENLNLEIIEENKIPEKLEIEDDGNTITLFGEKENEWTILDNVDVIICNKINSIIDYLKNKGE